MTTLDEINWCVFLKVGREFFPYLQETEKKAEKLYKKHNCGWMERYNEKEHVWEIVKEKGKDPNMKRYQKMFHQHDKEKQDFAKKMNGENTEKEIA